MSATETSFNELDGIPVRYDRSTQFPYGSEGQEKDFFCTFDLKEQLNKCLKELFEIWPLERPRAMLSAGTIGDGQQQHGKGKAFDLDGFLFEDSPKFMMIEYPKRRALYIGINSHLFLYFSQVLSYHYPDHDDHFHVDFNFSFAYRESSNAQTFYLQSALRYIYGRDIGDSGPEDDGVDGLYGPQTQEAIDSVMVELGLTGQGGLNISSVWENFLTHTRNRAFQSGPIVPPPPPILGEERVFDKCLSKVHNRGSAPEDFLNELVDWALEAPDEIFARNENFDIYSKIVSHLGPWDGLLHRKAAMLEVLRVLGGFESSWDWNEGPDSTNPNSNTDCTEEAGIFQCSGDSMNFDSSLRNLLETHSSNGSTTCKMFQKVTKQNHEFAMEYCARLIRLTTLHHGPIKRDKPSSKDHIYAWIRRDCVDEFRNFLI